MSHSNVFEWSNIIRLSQSRFPIFNCIINGIGLWNHNHLPWPMKGLLCLAENDLDRCVYRSRSHSLSSLWLSVVGQSARILKNKNSSSITTDQFWMSPHSHGVADGLNFQAINLLPHNNAANRNGFGSDNSRGWTVFYFDHRGPRQTRSDDVIVREREALAGHEIPKAGVWLRVFATGKIRLWMVMNDDGNEMVHYKSEKIYCSNGYS